MERTRTRRGALVAGLAAVAALAAAPGLAQAQEPPVARINGSPLDVFANGLGALQVRFDGETDGEFFPPDSDTGNAGLEVVYLPADGSDGSTLSPTPVSAPTASTPRRGTHVLHSMYALNNPLDDTPLLQVTEDVTYVNGRREVALRYAIQNVSAAPVTFRAGELADLYMGGSDTGTGVFSPISPRFIGGQSPTGGLGGIREVTPWTHYQESFYGDVYSNFENTDTTSPPAGLADSFDPNNVDNGAGAQWDVSALAPSATTTIDVKWEFSPLPNPVAGKSVNIEPARGTVRYKVPGGHYVTLAKGAQIPTGSTIDTSKGRVTLTSAADRGSTTTQHAWFYKGVFKIGQTKGKRPITTLSLAGPKPKCGRTKAKKSDDATVSRKKKRRAKRRLWGDGKGRFRTKGQFSSATVRGTKWLTEDTCQGTLVKVKRGVVSVRDFTLRKTFKVKAGHQHLSRPPKKHKRKHK